MGLGGPVWHASAAPRGPVGRDFLRRQALRALVGVGDASLGEWEEWTGRVYHVRRRLNASERAIVGDVVDVRGTPEGERRHALALRRLPTAVAELMIDENVDHGIF